MVLINETWENPVNCSLFSVTVRGTQIGQESMVKYSFWPPSPLSYIACPTIQSVLLVSYRDALWLPCSFENLNFDDALMARLVPRVRAAVAATDCVSCCEDVSSILCWRRCRMRLPRGEGDGGSGWRAGGHAASAVWWRSSTAGARTTERTSKLRRGGPRSASACLVVAVTKTNICLGAVRGVSTQRRHEQLLPRGSSSRAGPAADLPVTRGNVNWHTPNCLNGIVYQAACRMVLITDETHTVVWPKPDFSSQGIPRTRLLGQTR